MSVILEPAGSSAMELDEFIEYATAKYIPDDQDSLLRLAPELAALALNRRFILDTIHRDLTSNRIFQAHNGYTDQSLIISETRTFRIRLNIWSPPVAFGGSVRWDEKRCSYNLPHNHNFDLLTVGYSGSGYVTELYDLNYGAVVGYVGENVKLTNKKTVQLSPGKVLLYQRDVDVHNQLPPTDGVSMSLNLMPVESPLARHTEQFIFDTEAGRIIEHVSASVSAQVSFLNLAVLLGDSNTLQYFLDIALAHPSPRVRATAYSAAAKLSAHDSDLILQSARNDPHGLVQHWASMQTSGS